MPKPATLRTSYQLRLQFYLWATFVSLCLLTLAIILGNGYRFNTNIMALLPVGNTTAAEQLAQQHLIKQSDHRVILLLQSEKTTDRQRESADAIDQAARLFLQGLEHSPLLTTVQAQADSASFDAFETFYFSRRYQLLDNHYRQRLQQQDQNLITETLNRLYSPLASTISAQLTEDPLQLFWHWRQSRLEQTAFSPDNGWLMRSTEHYDYRLILLTLADSPYNMDYQARLLALISNLEQQLPDSIHLLKSGLIFHAAHGASQAQQEISTIGFGSVLGILLLLFVCFRKLSVIALALVPIAIGCCVALTASLLVFEEVHLITLAFGAGLVGVGIDYALHYFCTQAEMDSLAQPQQTALNTSSASTPSNSTIQRILPSLLLGLLSSSLAYAAQGMAPFPGLQQMAFFSAIGLIAACLTVIFWLPWYSARSSQPISTRLFRPNNLERLDRFLQKWPNVSDRWFKALLVLITALLITHLFWLQTSDDLRQLQTSPPALLEQDHKVQTLLNAANPGQYFILEAENIQALLMREESFKPHLQQAVQDGWIKSFMATSQFVPSRVKQQQNFQLIADQVYAEQGLLQQLTQTAGLSNIEKLAQQQFQQTPFQAITVSEWLRNPASEAASHLWLGEHNQQHFSLITLTGIQDRQAITELTQLALRTTGVSFVDQPGNISRVLKYYRGELKQWLFIAYLAVASILYLRYGKQAWRVIAAPALASLISLNFLTLAGVEINFFHTIALLLVLGIGLDASIFLRDSQHKAASWIAISLSCITTLLAFGLLSLSKTPVLHFFGETVLWGIIAAWFLTPCFSLQKNTPFAPHHSPK